MRYLLQRHPNLVLGIAFFAIMTAIGTVIAPFIARNFGLSGGLVAIAGIFALACWMERR